MKREAGGRGERQILSKKDEKIKVIIVYGEKKLTDCMKSMIRKRLKDKKSGWKDGF